MLSIRKFISPTLFFGLIYNLSKFTLSEVRLNSNFLFTLQKKFSIFFYQVAFLFFFNYPPSSGIASCVGTAGMVPLFSFLLHNSQALILLIQEIQIIDGDHKKSLPTIERTHKKTPAPASKI